MTLMTITLAISIIFVAVIIAVILLFRKIYSNKPNDQALLLIQNQINEITRMLDSRLSESTRMLSSQFGESAKIIKDVTEK